MTREVELLKKLIAFKSVTPHDKGCQDWMITFLEQLGFKCFRFNNEPVNNFFALIGEEGPLLVFAGHTDVVPTGVIENWQTPPFELTDYQGKLIGRGAADMKGSLACMLCIAEKWASQPFPPSGRLGFLITSGEEGDDFDKGTPFIMAQLDKLNMTPDYCIVGEPSSLNVVGDTIKVGRRGSLSGQLQLKGQQGHVAYPHLANNPIHGISNVLAMLCNTTWDEGNTYFPPTTFQITHIQSGGLASNIIPGELVLNFNFRFSTEQTPDTLINRVNQCFINHALTPEIMWRTNGLPFLTSHGLLLKSTLAAIEQCVGLTPELSTSGGTSDGRFIAPYQVEVIELGLINKSIHQVNEYTTATDLIQLTQIYYQLTQNILAHHAD